MQCIVHSRYFSLFTLHFCVLNSSIIQRNGNCRDLSDACTAFNSERKCAAVFEPQLFIDVAKPIKDPGAASLAHGRLHFLRVSPCTIILTRDAARRVLVLIFGYIPVLSGLLMTFQEFNIMGGHFGSAWVDFAQFEHAFFDFSYHLVLWNSFIIGAMKLVITFPLSILLAILIDQFRNVLFKRTVQTLIYLPTFYLDQLYTALFRQFRAMMAPSTNFLL